MADVTAVRRPSANEKLQPGDQVWYRLRINHQLREARVVEQWENDDGTTRRLRRPRPGTVNLEVLLDPDLDSPSRDNRDGFRALRESVEEGPEEGKFCRQAPASESADLARWQMRKEVEREMRLKQFAGKPM